MSIVVTNQLTITSDRADEVVSRFAQNMQSLDTFDGFEGFELCKPTEPADDRWIVITRWRDQEAFLGWRNSRKFREDHGWRERESNKEEEAKRPPHGSMNSVVRNYDVMLTKDAAE